MHRIASLILVLLVALFAWIVPGGPADARKISDVRGTKHNLSVSNTTGTPTAPAVKSAESQICVFCHTPHAAESQPGAPLWNRQLRNATYTIYESASIDASVGQPDGLSKLCLSCHDGALALGSVNVINGKPGANITGKPGDIIPFSNATSDGRMPGGLHTELSGFTRNLGMDLSNDHPISFTYNAALATADGELNTPPTKSTVAGKAGQVIVGDRNNASQAGVSAETRSLSRPLLPLEEGKVQCTTCHDPHIREDTPGAPSIKFLRLNRLQSTAPTGTFNEDSDQFCLACHNKGGADWALSAHANESVAGELYKATVEVTRDREFPASMPVWKAGCLNCHDTHTVQGSRRLLREGTNNTSVPKRGGEPAIEETCYQCHSSTADPANILATNTTVPNIKTDFTTSPGTHMPINNADQKVTKEVHNIGTGAGTQRGKDFVEDPNLLGRNNNLPNRHVECTDCHNPHRVIKNRLFNGTASAPDAAGTHSHAAGHTNIASGVLRGSTGIEILTWKDGAKFTSKPATWRELRGVGASNAVGSDWVTREYQVCLKCHSAYAYGDTPPLLGNTGGGTATGVNSVSQYTDQGMEFQAPHPGTTSRIDSGAYRGLRPGCATPNASECGTGACVCKTAANEVNYQTNNWRAWHPVLAATGRTAALRSTGTNAWKWPWNNDVGTQTMYCSDCHGSSTVANTVDPNCTTASGTANPGCGDDGRPWGPHGSANNFILKGVWGQGTTASTANALCIKCHNPTSSSAFNGGGKGNLHAYHQDKIGRIECTWCHIAVPHGWKNRSFLVNLNDVGEEAGLPPGTQVRNGTKNRGYTRGPYYLNAMLKIRSFATSGSWSEGNCGSAGTPGNGQGGRDWMRDSSESCDSPQ